MATTAQQAKGTTIFVIENGEIEATTFYDHVMESATQVTSPRGIWYQVFAETIQLIKDDEGNSDTHWAIKDWGRNAHNRTPKVVAIFDTEEEADDECFRLHEANDFAKDDQRDTQYWFSKEEAEVELLQRNAE